MSAVMQTKHVMQVLNAVASTPATRLIKVMRKRTRIVRSRVQRSFSPAAAGR